VEIILMEEIILIPLTINQSKSQLNWSSKHALKGQLHKDECEREQGEFLQAKKR
jgi:hypothetical protein